MPDTTPLIKEAGEDKGAHEARLAATALPLFDVQSYVEEFGRTIVPAYRRGIAARELPADVGLARSIIPPGTAAVRDFTRLAPRIPELIAEKCVGCMACVSSCPDSAILGVVTPEPELDATIAAFAAAEPEPETATLTARSHFAATQKYGDVPARKGHDRGSFGLFVDPVHCKGCAECVDVCAGLGHDALIMIDKVEEGPSGESTIERYRRDMRFFRSLPPTPAIYRNEKALADLMLGEHAFGERYRALKQVALHQFIHKQRARGRFGPDWVPADDHVERALHAERAGQALRAAGPGQDSEFHLGQRELRARRSDPIMTAHCQLQAAAHRDAMDRGDHRLGAALDLRHQLARIGSRERDRRVELADFGA